METDWRSDVDSRFFPSSRPPPSAGASGMTVDTAVVARRVKAVINAGPDARGPDGTVRLYLKALTPCDTLVCPVLAYVRCAVRVASGGQNVPVPPS
jgi:hypothetical protein